MDWKRILENDQLPVTMDEEFTCRDFTVSKMQAACVGLHTISKLFLRDGNSH